MMAYAVTGAFVWDEGFHLLAAQLIQQGKRPYLDFCFPQTPLNAYWNAGWMSVFGDSWRVTHVAAALLLGATLFMTAYWSLRAFAVTRSSAVYATVNVLLLGTNVTVFQFGPIAQAYAMCMCCAFGGFVLLGKRSAWRVLASGLLTGIAAGASLLVAPIAPVFLGAVAIHKEHRWRNIVLFLAGCIVPFAPVVCLFAQSPWLTFFNVVQYQAVFRRENWGNATSHDADVLTSWVDSGGALLLALLLAAGLVVAWRRRAEWSQFGLCIAACVALIAYISTAHPTFARYYIVGAPFYTSIATVGFVWFSERLFPAARPLWPAAGLAVILIIATIRFVILGGDSTTWRQYEKVAAKVAQVTRRHSTVFADEQVYFLLHWIPPPGMEFSYSHKMSVPPAEAARLHIIPDAELQKETSRHRFAVFQTCDDEKIDKWHLDSVYQHRQDFDDCSVFW